MLETYERPQAEIFCAVHSEESQTNVGGRYSQRHTQDDVGSSGELRSKILLELRNGGVTGLG